MNNNLTVKNSFKAFWQQSWKKMLLFLAVFGPATITAMADNDATGVATYSISGAQLGYPILFLCHEAEKTIEKKHMKIDRIQPDLGKRAMPIIFDLSDMLVYYGYNDSDERVLWSKPTEDRVCGCRGPIGKQWPETITPMFDSVDEAIKTVTGKCYADRRCIITIYGAPKIGHYFYQEAFAPLHACVIFKSVNNNRKAVSWPVFLLDDADALKGSPWEVVVRAYDAKLQLLKRESYRGSSSIAAPQRLGQFSLTAQQTDTSPLLVVTEVKKNGTLADRSFYFVNYEAVKGGLFKLPRTTLSLVTKQGQAVVTNKGTVPAVGAAVLQLGHLDTFTADANYFWLDPGESKVVHVNSTDGLKVEGWNGD